MHKNVKENEVLLVFRKNKKNTNINVNELVQHMSTKLGRAFAVTNVKQSIQTNRNINSFKLPSRKKIEYRFTSDKIRYNSRDDTNSFLWLADAESSAAEFGLIVLKARIKCLQTEAQTEVKNDDTRDRRPNYKYNEVLSDSRNWTKKQKSFFKQCKCSFKLLADNTFNFHNNFWEAVLLNATDENINNFIRVYSSESIQVFRWKRNEGTDSEVSKIDATFERIFTSMHKSKTDDDVDKTTLTVKQMKSLTLRCFKMDDPEKIIKKKTAVDAVGRSTKRRKVVGSLGSSCKCRMNIKVFQYFDKKTAVGQPVAIINDNFDSHTHAVVWGNRLKEKLHPIAIKKADELFNKIKLGRRQFVTMMLRYCQNDLKTDISSLPENKLIDWTPNRNDPAFFPNKDKIESLYRRLNQARYGGQTIKDQVKLQELIEQIKQDENIWQENDYLYFQPYKPDKHNDATDEIESGQEFLVVYQNKFQRDMFLKFGKDIVGIDCTYNTTKYGLKLYWLVVLDSLRRIRPAGFFVTQNETDDTIGNCLNQIKAHMKNVGDQCEPNVWIGDKDSAQMNAVAEIYPNSLYWLCIFHVQQAFNRTGRGKCRNQQEAEYVMEKLSDMMYTRSERDCNEIQQQILRGRSTQLKTYLITEWFQEEEKRKWCMCYRNNIYTNNTHTSNIVESMNNATKNSFLISMKDKSATELHRVLITEMIPQLESRYKIEQFTASRHWRTKPTFDLPDIFFDLPHSILIKIQQEKTKSTAIDASKIVDHGDDIFTVPSTVNPDTESRTVNMQEGKCNCIIVKESKIVCRHMLKVIEEFGDSHTYSIENIDIDWFVNAHKTDATYGTEQNTQDSTTSFIISNSNSNDNSNTARTTNEDVDIDNNQNNFQSQDEEYDIPIPVSESKKNLQTFNSLRQQLKTIESHLWDLKRRGQVFTEFRTTGKAADLLEQFQDISSTLIDVLNNGEEDELPATGLEYQSEQKPSRKEAEKHLDRLRRLDQCSSQIPKGSQKGRPTKRQQKQKQSQQVNHNANSTNNRPRRTTAKYATNHN